MGMTDFDKQVDESWKDSVAQEKEKQRDEAKTSPQQQQDSSRSGANRRGQQAEPKATAETEINFLNYVTSLAYQTMIFLGEIPNPMADRQIEVNLQQAKLLIDTLVLIREKTKGNLNKDEEDLLNSAVYELQVKYVAKASPQGS
jgi:hypothetical protein